MNKQKLIDVTAKTLKLKPALVQAVLEVFLEKVQDTLEKEESVTLSGFGTFFLSKRKAGKGFNPHTKKDITLPEIRVPKFRAGKHFKERLR